MDTSVITDMLGDYLVTILTEYCITSVDATGYQAGLVRQGKLQEDPVKLRIYLLVNNGDPLDTADTPTWRDTIMGDGEWGISSREIGGGERWWRKYTVEIGVYLVKTKENRDDSRSIALWVLGRAQQAVKDHMGVDLTDSFGEHAFLMLCDSTVPVQSGGPPQTFIWRERLRVKVLTEKP